MDRSVDARVNGFLDRLALNKDIIHNAYLCFPVEEDHLEFSQVGRGRVSSPEWCGRQLSWNVCNDKNTHKGVVLDAVDYTDKVAVSHGHSWCKNPNCAICFLRGWVLRAMRGILGKVTAGVEKGFGEPEHFTVSPPRSMCDLPEPVVRKKAEDALRRRGFMGEALVFHGRRIRRGERSLKWGPHYHGVGFPSGGYDRCRNCSFFEEGRNRNYCHNDEFCNGFEQRTRREYEKDGFIVKVLGKRASGKTWEESVAKTLVYILSHATFRVGIRRFYVVTYSGVLANKRLKSRKVEVVQLCPACLTKGVHNEMKKCVYRGKEFIATNIGDLRYRRVFASEEFDGSGLPLWEDYGGGDLSG